MHLILADLPHGTTSYAWDKVIDLDALWREYRRIITPTGAIVLFGSQPFTTKLAASNIDWLRDELIWKKSTKTDFLRANAKHLKQHETVLVFAPAPAIVRNGVARMTYNPQGLVALDTPIRSRNSLDGRQYGGKRISSPNSERTQTHRNYPVSILEFPSVKDPLHPTEKPVELLRYLVRTYSNPNDVVLDNTMGSGSTGEAALLEGRKFIGIEREPEYYAVAMGRLSEIYAAQQRQAQPKPSRAPANDNTTGATNEKKLTRFRRRRLWRVERKRLARQSECDFGQINPQITPAAVASPVEPIKVPSPANDERPLRFATTCSGIEGVSLAWEPLGMQAQFFSEVAPFPKAVLAHHWPHVPDLGDLARIDGRQWRGKVDVLWGSLPCQSFSTIGRRKGLKDQRGALSLNFVNLANQIGPDIIVIENAKGLLFDRQAFNALLQALCGPHERPEGRFPKQGSCEGPLRRAAWRVLDALDFGLPQHRERVFLVATSAASGIDPAEILALGQGAPWGSRPRREDQSRASRVGPEGPWFVNGDTRPKVRFEQTATLRAEAGHAFVVQDGVARRLVATEWERLQGIPDGHTLISWKGGMARESLRKRAIGNSLAVPVVRWIGERIIACSSQAVVTEPEMMPLAA